MIFQEVGHRCFLILRYREDIRKTAATGKKKPLRDPLGKQTTSSHLKIICSHAPSGSFTVAIPHTYDIGIFVS